MGSFGLCLLVLWVLACAPHGVAWCVSVQILVWVWMSITRHQGVLEHSQQDDPSRSCFACCNLDLVCWRGVFSGSRLLTGWGRDCVDGRLDGKGSGVCGLPLGRRRLFSFFVMMALMCRVGEAAVPGPANDSAPCWRLGACNPSGFTSKGHLLCKNVDIWSACETHLSVASFRRFRGELRSCGSPFKWCSCTVSFHCL